MNGIRIVVVQRRFLYPSRAEQWANAFNKITTNPQAEAESVRTWYGAKAIVWLYKEFK